MVEPFPAGTRAVLTVPAVTIMPIEQLSNAIMETLIVSGVTIKGVVPPAEVPPAQNGEAPAAAAPLRAEEIRYRVEELDVEIPHTSLRKLRR